MNEHEADEIVAQMRAAFDQFQASGREVALLVANYHATLLAAGFERGEAVELTLAYQEQVLGWLLDPPTPASDDDDDDDD